MSALVRAGAAHNGPIFIRAGRAKVPVIYTNGQQFSIGKAVELVAGIRRHGDRARPDGGRSDPGRAGARGRGHIGSRARHAHDQAARPRRDCARRFRNRRHRLSPRNIWSMVDSAFAWRRWSRKRTRASWSSSAFRIPTRNPVRPTRYSRSTDWWRARLWPRSGGRWLARRPGRLAARKTWLSSLISTRCRCCRC